MNGGRGRSSSPSRGVARSRSGELAGMQRRPPPRGRSGSPSRGIGRSRSGELATMQRATARSRSPSQGIGRSRSGELATMQRATARSRSPSRGVGRARSGDLASMQRAAARGRSSSPSRGIGRAKSHDLSSMQRTARGRSASPSRNLRGRSNSPSRGVARSTSRSINRNMASEGRSVSPSLGSRSRSRSRSRDGVKNGKVRKGRKRPLRAVRKAPKRIGKYAKKAPKRLGKYAKKKIAPKEDCPMWKIMSYAIPIIVLLASIGGIIVATGNADKFTPDFLGKLKNEDVVDPFSQTTSDGVIARWDTQGKSGLTIDVINAMGSKWGIFFNLAVADWEYGNPDALSIKMSDVEEDKACKPLNGKIKVCNGNYGETKWRGINSATFDSSNFILSSAAQMNEFYLNAEGDDAKQYTMCHELGHAFGLAHTDETFGNPDLGNCLDYTDNFADNKHPDVSNYETLLSMYGAVGGRRHRGLRQTRSDPHVPGHIWDKIHHAVEKLKSRVDDMAHEDGWKLLHRSRHGEEHEMEFEEGYKVRVHMLLAKN